MATIPSLRAHFLRTFLGISVVTVSTVCACFSAGDYISMRRTEIENVSQVASAASQVFLLVANHHEPAQLATYLEAFKGNKKLAQLCIYNADNRLVSSWHNAVDAHCPAMMTALGIHADAFVVHIAQPIESEGKYAGMVYAEGELFSFAQWAVRGGIALGALVIIAVAASIFAARLTARSVAAPLLSLRRQVECLKDNDIMTCAIPAVTAETAALSASIGSLRTHFDENTVPKEVFAKACHWHWEILSGLLVSLRHRLSADSPLLEELNDYALLMQTGRGDILPPHRKFDIAQVLDTALTQARARQPRNEKLHLTVSLQPGMKREWSGQPEMMEALFRHLLLIGLKRTRSGFVCLRLEGHASSDATPFALRISLQDSGPFIQRWQLQQLLSLAKEDAMPGDISWLLATRIFKRLNGTLTGCGGEENGLSLEGSMQLLPYIGEVSNALLPSISRPQSDRLPPLVLAVTNDKENQDTVNRLVMEGCNVFTVGTHQDALEWAPVLPFSAIILNAGAADATQDITRRLRHRIEDGVIHSLPLWIVTARFSFLDFDCWRQQGISELLLKPLQPLELKRLVHGLSPRDSSFYLAQDQMLRDDMKSTAQSMPAMNSMLAEQIACMEPVIESLAKNHLPENARDKVHAVRSAALTLGYYRLAGLMGQIEHATISYHSSFPEKNWEIVLEVLQSAGFTEVAAIAKYPSPPSAALHRHDGEPDHRAW